MDPGKTAVSRFVHILNTSSPRDATVSGTVTDLSFVQ